LKWSIRSQLLKYINKDLIEYIINEETNKYTVEEPKIIKLRNYQEKAVDALIKNKSRNKQIIMACGTGKTVVMFEYLKQISFENKKVLLLFPSLQLISQVYKRFISYLNNDNNILCICSQMDKKTLTCGETLNDSEVDRIYNEFMAMDTNKIYTTDQSIIKKRLESDNIIVFCTYQSCKLLEKQYFDICFFDEAHKTVNNLTFGYLLTDDHCTIKERIYMTATPRYYKGKEDKCISMSNKDIYGEEVYNYTFKNAIKDNYILDFQVVTYITPPELEEIITEKYIKKDNLDVSANDVITAIQLAQHIKKYGTSNKILTYHNTVNNAHKFKQTLNYIFDKFNLYADIFIMSGKTRVSKRVEIFDEFEESDIGIICSARVLNEGVDLPCVDTVMFVDPRKSTIDVTQCVGRGMRLYENMDKCTVIIPVHYDNVNKEHNFSPIIKILTEMNKLDDKIVEYFSLKKRNNKIVVRNMDVIDLIDDENYEIKYSVEDVINGLKVKIMSSNQLSWEIKKHLLFEYCNETKNIPPKRRQYKDQNIGSWLQNQKNKINSTDDELYKKLSINQYTKDSLDKYLEYKKENKNKEKLKWNEWKNLLFDYCNENKNIPPKRRQYKDQNIGSWLQNQKNKINSTDDELYKKLSINQYAKDSLDKYLEYKKKNKNKEKLKWNEWKNLLFDYCNENKNIPTKKIIYKSQRIGQWLQDQKKKINSTNDELYKKLSINQYVKDSLDEYLDPWKKWNEWNDLLFEYSDNNKKIPTVQIIYKSQRIGSWLHNQKRKINSTDNELYKKLSINQYVKDSLDEYLDPRKKWNKHKDLLFEYSDNNKTTPPAKTIYKNQRIGGWLQHQKDKINSIDDELYKKLSINQYVKENLDEYLDPWKKWNEWKNLLFDYCNENKNIPTKKIIYKGRRIGSWLKNQKNKINGTDNELYKKLSINQYVKNSLDEYLDPWKKWNEWKNLLFEYSDSNKKIPTVQIIYKSQCIGSWLHNQKGKINSTDNELYKKLSINQYVKDSLDEYLDPCKKWNEWKNLLFDYCNENKNIPTKKIIYKGRRIGSWLQDQKKKINSTDDELYKKLLINQYVKDSLDKYLEKKLIQSNNTINS